MNLKRIVIRKVVERKILRKHRLTFGDVHDALMYGNPVIFKMRNNLYIAISKFMKYLTIIFKYEDGNTVVKTAYQSSGWQKKLYERKQKTR